jgi:uncharacterized membrane protein YjgN (DUF898 family)
MSAIEMTAASAPPAVPSVPQAAATSSAATSQLRFIGREGPYWRLLVRGAILLMFTLGIYRFWLSTDMRRYLWANSEIAGDGLEYTGTARELLLGFLIALATLVPIYTALFIFGLAVLGQWSAFVAFAVITWFGHFAVYRARRYRLTRTVFRGLRFHQTGSAWRYATAAMLWWTIIIATFGLAYPWAQASLERYKMRHSFFGNLKGGFGGSGTRLFLRGGLMWLVVIGPLIAGIVIAGRMIDWTAVSQVMAEGGENMMARLETASPDFATAIVYVVTACIWTVVAAAVLYPAFQALMLRWWISGLRFGDVRPTSHLRTRQIYAVYLRFLGFALFFAFIVGIVAGSIFGLFNTLAASDGNPDLMEILGVVAGVIGYVVIMLGYSTIYQVTVRLRLWRFGLESTTLAGTAALDRVRAEGAASSSFGEGLADALNVGGL